MPDGARRQPALAVPPAAGEGLGIAGRHLFGPELREHDVAEHRDDGLSGELFVAFE